MAKSPKLASNRSARWAFMEQFEVPNYDRPGTYLTRIRLVQTPLFGVYLHRFDGPDPRATLHDHPWPFLSLVLRGGYVERRLDLMTMEVDEHHAIRWVNFMPKGGAHAIMRLTRVPTWSLMFVGRRSRIWGYWEQAWKHYEMPPVPTDPWTWTQFDRHPHAAEFDAALARRKVVA